MPHEEKCLPVLTVGDAAAEEDAFDSLHPNGEEPEADRGEHRCKNHHASYTNSTVVRLGVPHR